MHTALTIHRSDRALALAVAASVLAWLAFAAPVSADPPGANGTVKIHEAPQHKNGSVNANDPKVCQFVIHGFGFDSSQTGEWWIQEHKWGSGDSSKAVLSGDFEADANGDWSQPDGTNAHDASHSQWYTLDNGHYKLYVEARSGPTTYKHKVFKVDCPPGGGVLGPTPTPTPTPGQQGITSTPTPSPTGGAAAATSSPRGGVLGATGSPAAGAAGAGNLPDTAVPMEVAGSLGGLLMILSGIAYTVSRRRNG